MSRLTPDTREVDPLWRSSAVSVTGAIFVAGLLLWIVHRLWGALFLPWWFNTDEIVLYYEAIRQLRLDPHQTFFDIPGTPFITLTSLATGKWWALYRVVGRAAAATPSDFAFVHIQGVVTMMRAFALGFYVSSVALLFDIVRRCSGAIAAVLTAFAFATLPIHVQYSSFARTESLGSALSLAAIWIVLYSRWRSTPAGYGIAGILAGVAAAARYHFALTGFPVLIAILLLSGRSAPAQETSSRDRFIYRAAFAGCMIAIAGALLTVLFKAHFLGGRNWLTDTMMLTTPAGSAQYAGAKLTLAKLWIALGVGAVAALMLYRSRNKFSLARLLAQPSLVVLLLGFVFGFLAAHPEFLWRGEYQLRSMQFYADWNDPNLTRMNLFERWRTVAGFYFASALPKIAWIPFVAGAACILWKRQTVPLAFLFGSLIFFFAHSLTMRMWQHHVIPWLPFLCFVPVAPVSWLAELIPARLRRPSVAVALTAAASIAMLLLATIRLKDLDRYFVTSRQRTDQINAMDRWASRNIPAGSNILESYYALNSDGFYRWIENQGVSVPDFVARRRTVKIWWLDRAELEGKAGFVCISPADISVFRPDLERTHPGATLNPFDDARFQPLARFGDGPYELQVFHFDFRPKGS